MKKFFRILINGISISLLSSLPLFAIAKGTLQIHSTDQYGRVNAVTLDVEIAKTPQERAQGLQDRSSLPEDAGMLFVFETPDQWSFWMKNTKIPLDLAFINQHGVITEVTSMQPQSAEITQSAFPVLYALEVNKDFFSKHRLSTGAKVTLPPEALPKPASPDAS